MSHEKKWSPSFGMYDIYQTPDGEDCLVKTAYLTKYSTILGGIFASYEIILVSKPVTIASVIGRYGRFMLPFAAMGAAFGTTACLSGQIRKKNDSINHLLAGLAAGSVWGFKFKTILGCQVAFYCGVLAMYTKFFHDRKMPVFDTMPYCNINNKANLNFSVKFYDDPGRPSVGA